MSEDHTVYTHPLTTRYASKEMQKAFSDDERIKTWRKLWLRLATAQHQLGLDAVSQEALDELAAAVDSPVNYKLAAEEERRVRHDVMAHVHVLAQECPTAAGVIHLGATSCYVACNADLIIQKQALFIAIKRLIAVIEALAIFCDKQKGLPVLGATHFQAAQMTTMGKRASVWLRDLVQDVQDLDRLYQEVPFRGAKGTTGTQASYLALFHGNHDKVDRLDQLVTKMSDFPDSTRLLVTGQTYPRSWDLRLLYGLSTLAASMHKIATDIRLLAGLGEVAEPLAKDQIGSSAMAYKRNPMRSERICSLAKYIGSLPNVAWNTAATQWLERSLDDSAARRLIIPEAFLATDACLVLMLNVVQGLDVFPGVVQRRINAELPFLATENIIMAVVEAGGDRQQCHERIRVLSREAAERVKLGDGTNDLVERIMQDPFFEKIHGKMADLLRPETFIGRAPEQVSVFLEKQVKPTLESLSVSKMADAAVIEQGEVKV